MSSMIQLEPIPKEDEEPIPQSPLASLTRKHRLGRRDRANIAGRTWDLEGPGTTYLNVKPCIDLLFITLRTPGTVVVLEESWDLELVDECLSEPPDNPIQWIYSKVSGRISKTSDWAQTHFRKGKSFLFLYKLCISNHDLYNISV